MTTLRRATLWAIPRRQRALTILGHKLMIYILPNGRRMPMYDRMFLGRT